MRTAALPNFSVQFTKFLFPLRWLGEVFKLFAKAFLLFVRSVILWVGLTISRILELVFFHQLKWGPFFFIRPSIVVRTVIHGDVVTEQAVSYGPAWVDLLAVFVFLILARLFAGAQAEATAILVHFAIHFAHQLLVIAGLDVPTVVLIEIIQAVVQEDWVPPVTPGVLTAVSAFCQIVPINLNLAIACLSWRLHDDVPAHVPSLYVPC